MPTFTAYGIICVTLIAGLTAWMVRFYARPQTHYVVYVTVFLAWFLTFSMALLVPIDLVPGADRDVLDALWNVIYWTGFILAWTAIPFLQGYYECGDFTFKGKVIASLKVNLLFYGIAAILLIIFLIYVAVANKLGGAEILGFAVCLSNTWGLILSVLLLGYGLVEVPRDLWHGGNRLIRLKLVQHHTAQVNTELEQTKDELYQTLRLVEHLREYVPKEELREGQTEARLSRFLTTIESHCPNEMEMELDVSSASHGGHTERLEIVTAMMDKQPTEKTLIELHYHVKRLVRNMQLVDAQWRDIIDEAIELEELLALAKTPQSAPSWQGGYKEAFMWRFRVMWQPYMWRILGVLCGMVSVVIIWCEATLISSNKDISPLAPMIDSVKDNPSSMQVLALMPLSYLFTTAFFAMFRLRLSKYYHMNGRRRTDENSLLFNGSYLLRLGFPLVFNFFQLVRADGMLSFYNVVGKMDVIPFFGHDFNIYFPLMIAVFCLLTAFNIYGRLLRCMGLARFEFSENYEDDVMEEGKMILRKHKRKRQQQLGSTNLL